jgi:hypothetical protein
MHDRVLRGESDCIDITPCVASPSTGFMGANCGLLKLKSSDSKPRYFIYLFKS